MITCIAEIGGNHRGSLSTAMRMCEVVATYCTEHFNTYGTERFNTARPPAAIKFQKRSPQTADYGYPHPEPYHSYGTSYGAHRKALEFDIAQHATLKTHCDSLGATYACSVWDVQAAREIIGLDPEWIKVPSACNLDFELLDCLRTEYSGDIHVSLGMTTRDEIQHVVDALPLERTVLYACTSDYPAAFADVRLGELDWLRNTYGRDVKALGFSGHHAGIAVDMAAVTFGVAYIERHFTFNRTWKGTDHAASLEPDGFRKLMRDAQAVAAALGSKPPDGLLPCEHTQRTKLKVLAHAS